MKRCLLCLQELPIFQGLEKKEFANICFSTIKKSVAKGDFLFRQGEPANTLCLIKAGKIKLVQVTEGGREIILDVLGPGEVLGETVLFQEQDQLYSAVALEETKLCCFNQAQFEEVIRQNPDFAIKIIGYLGNKLHQNMRLAGESAGTSVKEKLLRLFIRLADEYGRKINIGTVIELNITQQEIANMIGASRVMVAQVLKELKEAGIVGRQGKYYILQKDLCVEKNFS